MKALLASIVLLVGADWALNHGNASKRVFGGIAHVVGATGEEASDSVFSK